MNKEEIYFKYGNEEVNAIDVLEEIAKIGFNDYYYDKQCKAVEIAVNYIDRLQKENEDIKKELKVTSQMNSNLIVKLEKELENLKEVDRQICCEELITKDKYQDILKEIEETTKRQLIITTNYWKDKIRNKIKELKDEIEINNYNIYHENWLVIKVLKELLGELNDKTRRKNN